MKKTWFEKYQTWVERSGNAMDVGTRDAYKAGRRHQRKVNNEKAAGVRALLKETLDSIELWIVKSNRLEAENKALRMEKYSLMIELNKSCAYRSHMGKTITELEAKLAKSWWQFWRKT
ncbi:hypothetical protein KAR91_04680 [Candidatus Pacearchaeota archaeon]|nr:hypothetical protein [Candidatus Pacearchaeota archaeon]